MVPQAKVVFSKLQLLVSSNNFTLNNYNYNFFSVKTHRFALDLPDDATAGCPGGDLETCIDVCPGFNKVAFGLCVTECGKRCP